MQHVTVEQFYLTAEALGITEKERSGLLQFIERTEQGNVENFDMTDHCGCIGHFAGIPISAWKFVCSTSLLPLFYPTMETDDDSWETVSIPQAVQATRNFLTGRGPCWTEVLKEQA